MKNTLSALLLSLGAVILSVPAFAATYQVDVKGAHAFINFKIQHLGYSWLYGRFNDFNGTFEYDASAPNASRITINIATKSIDSNHAERDKHLRGDDFLDVEKYPKSGFKSTKIVFSDDNNAMVTGEFTLKGVTRTISFPIVKMGEGSDPWGGYRAGFSGQTRIALKDYGINYNLGPASTHVDIEFSLEGIKQ